MLDQVMRSNRKRFQIKLSNVPLIGTNGAESSVCGWCLIPKRNYGVGGRIIQGYDSGMIRSLLPSGTCVEELEAPVWTRAPQWITLP